MAEEKKAMQLRLPVDLDQWFENEAKRLGVSKHGMIIMGLHEIRSDREAVKSDG